MNEAPPAVPAAPDSPQPWFGGAERVRSLRRGGLMFGAGHLLALGLGLASSALLTRAAQPATVAYYLLLLQAAMAVAVVFQMGLGLAALRFAPATRGAGGHAASALLRRRLLLLQVAVWLLAAPPVVLAWPALVERLRAPELANAGGLVVGLAALLALSFLCDCYLRAYRRYATSAALRDVVARLLIPAGLLAVAWRYQGAADWPVLAAVFVGAQLVVSLAYALALRSTSAGEESEERAAHSPPPLRTIASTAAVMGLRGVAGIAMVYSDLWVLSATSSHQEVAVYGMMARLLQVVSLSPILSGFLIPQEFALLHADGRREQMERLARSAATAVTLLSALALAGVVLLGRPFIRVALGEEYVRGWPWLLVLGVGVLWDAGAGAAGYLLQMTGHQVRLLLITLGAAACNLALAVWLAPRWGGYGVAVATTFSLVLLNTATVYSARRLLGIRSFAYSSWPEWRGALTRLLQR